MEIEFYRKTKKELPDYRELDDMEWIKDGDIVWSRLARSMMKRTSRPSRLLCGSYDHLVLDKNYLDNPLTNIRACEIVGFMIKRWWSEKEGLLLAKRKYSIWRKKMILTRQAWQDKSLPLP